MTPEEAAHAFVDAINSGDPDRMAGLMTENHTFIDSDGSAHPGREEMRVGWGQYFAMVPDFRIELTDTMSKGDVVALFGVAEGTFVQDGKLDRSNHWRVQAAWRVVVKGEKVAVWQLYVNPQTMVEIFNRIGSE